MVVFKNSIIQLIDNQIFNKMKTRILTLIALTVLSTGITKTVNAATSNAAVVTTLTDISTITKIEIHGNVEVYVSNGAKDQVQVYNKYYSESALVQSTNGVLRISSYTPEKLIVWVTANDLRSITAYDNSEVRSFGQLSGIELNINLHNMAAAKLDINSFNTTITLADHAKADLSGTAENFELNHNMASTIQNSNLAAKHFRDKLTGTPVAAINEEVIGF